MPPEPVHSPSSVLVTGGAGFIGSNLLLRLVSRHPGVSFVNLDKLTYAGNLLNLRSIEDASNYTFRKADIADGDAVAALFEEFGFDTVIHLAAESHVDRSILSPIDFVKTNLLGTATLLDAARKSWGSDLGGKRFYHVSTDEVFGSLGADGHFTEDTPYDPRSPYSASKAGSDHLVRSYGHTFDLPVVLSNCSNNYGPFQFPEKLIPLMIRNAVAGEPLPVYGDGSNVRDWIHVGDHCEAIETILLSGVSGKTYLVGGNAEKDNLSLVSALCDLVDKALDRPAGTSRSTITFVTDRPGHDFRYAIDCSTIEEELGWSPSMTLEEGLQKTVDWYLSNGDWLEATADESYQNYYDSQYSR